MKFTVYCNNKNNKNFWLSEDNSTQVWSPNTYEGNNDWVVEIGKGSNGRTRYFRTMVKLIIYLASQYGDIIFEYVDLSQEAPIKRPTSLTRSPIKIRKMQLE